MAKKKLLDEIFREEKKDRKKELMNVYKKFMCDHKIEEKGDEFSLLTPYNEDTDEGGKAIPKFKCEKCKKKLPAKALTYGEMKEMAKNLNSYIEVVKASIPNMTEDMLIEFAEHQLFIHLLPEMYQTHFLNKNGSDNDIFDDEGGDGETYHFNSGREDDQFGWEKKDKKSWKKKNNNWKKNNKHGNNKKHKGNGKRRNSSINDFYR